MNDQVEEVKGRVDIISLIGEYVPLKKAGRNFKAPCPFHSEKTPSFMVSPELQIFKCFGCQVAGDAFKFLELYEGMEFREALKFLADKVGVKLVTYSGQKESEKEKLLAINALAAKFYNFFLLSHPRGTLALSYLTKERRINEDTIKTFQLGYSPDSPFILHRFLVEKKGFKPYDIEAAGVGIVRNNTVYDRFAGRIMFPLSDARGNVVGFIGRVLPQAKTNLGKYVNSPETAIYHKSRILYGLNFTKEEIKKTGSAILVEGQMDLLPLWQAGIRNAVAIAGTSLTEDQVRLISRFTKDVIFSLDTDFAGDVAARRGIDIAQKEGLAVRVARLRGFKDPGEAVATDPEGYKNALKAAVGVWDYIIESIFAKGEVASGEGKGKVAREVVPVLAGISDRIVQSHYIGAVALKLGVPDEVVAKSVEEFLTKSTAGMTFSAPWVPDLKKAATRQERRRIIEIRLLSLCFQFDYKRILADVGKEVKAPLAKKIVEKLAEFAASKKEFSAAKFLSFLPSELKTGFSEMELYDFEKVSPNPDFFDREVEALLREIEILDIRQRLEELSAKMKEFENEREFEKLKDAQEKFGEIARKLSIFEHEEKKGIIFA